MIVAEEMKYTVDKQEGNFLLQGGAVFLSLPLSGFQGNDDVS
jgi:hypothetical protein